MAGPDESKPGLSGRSFPKAFQVAGPLFGSGIQMAAGVVAFLFMGRWLDTKFGTSPWLMLSGALLGAGGGLYSFIRTAIEIGKSDSENKSAG